MTTTKASSSEEKNSLEEEFSREDIEKDLSEKKASRKRSAGASGFTKHLYAVLHAHPEGMTVQQIVDAIGLEWRYNDAIRLFCVCTATGRRLEYGSTLFIDKAKLWYTAKRLRGMLQCGYVRRQGGRNNSRIGGLGVWFAGRPPWIKKPKLKPGRWSFDPEEYEETIANTRAWEKAKAIQFRRLLDGRIGGNRRDEEQLIYDVLCKLEPRKGWQARATI